MYLAEEIVIAEGSLERKERGRGINEVKTERESASERERERPFKRARCFGDRGRESPGPTDGRINNPLNEQTYICS